MLNDGQFGHLIKILWHDGIGISLYAKRLERGRFIWPLPADGTVAITPAQLAYMLDGIDWRNPVRTWRPEALRHYPTRPCGVAFGATGSAVQRTP